MLPRKKKAQKYEPANSTQVSQAREILKAASLKYHKNPTRFLKQQLTKARKNLDTAYLNAEADFIMGKIVTLEHLHSSNKHHAAWKTVKELSGKSNASPRIKGVQIKLELKAGSAIFRIFWVRKQISLKIYLCPWKKFLVNLISQQPILLLMN